MCWHKLYVSVHSLGNEDVPNEDIDRQVRLPNPKSSEEDLNCVFFKVM